MSGGAAVRDELCRSGVSREQAVAPVTPSGSRLTPLLRKCRTPCRNSTPCGSGVSREWVRYNFHVMHAHSSALRRGRYSEPGRIYLVTTVTRARERVFADFVLARLAIAQMRQITACGGCHTLAFVLMPDHLHWLIQLSECDLSRLVGRFKANSARWVNRQRNTPGFPVWQQGFHDHAVRRDEDLIALARYVVANPLRAGLAARPGDYPHWDAIWL